MKRLIITFLCAFSFIIPNLIYAVIMPVIDIGAIAQLIKQLDVLKEQATNIKAELAQLEDNQYRWSENQKLVNELGSIVQQTNGIAYNASNLNQQFQEAYPGYKAPQNYQEQYKNNINTTLNTLNGILQSEGMNANDFQNENIRLAFLQSQVKSAKGQTQAIQASAEIASEMITQIQLLRQTVIAQSNAQTTYYATKLQNEASAKAELDEVIQSGSTNIPKYGTSGHPLNPPNIY